MNYLALGDSYTVGEGVAPEETWAAVMARALQEEGVALEAPRVIAVTGWTTDELAAAMDAAEPLGAWDFVSLLIGVNNQYRGRDGAEYREQFETLLRRAIALAGGRTRRVLVVPGSSFNVPYRNHFRVTLLPDADTLREVFTRIDRLLARAAARDTAAA